MAISRVRALAAGILAAGAGMTLGHLTAALMNPASSPVLAVGAAVIDRTPAPLKDWAIEQFGEKDKLILLLSVSVVTLIVAGLSGLLARTRLIYGIAVQAVLVVLALGAAWERPGAQARDLLPGVLTLAAGIAVLALLIRLGQQDPGGAGSAYPSGSDTRRAFMGAAVTVAGSSAALGVLGERLGRTPDTTDAVLPKANSPLGELPVGLDKKYPKVSPLRTPTRSFYRVDTSLTVPRVDRSTWELKIDGDVDRPLTLTFDDLAAMDLVERDITMTCVSNTVGGSYVGAARWLGVRTADVLRQAGIRNPDDPRTQVLSTSVEGFTISTPIGALLDDRDALLAIGMNGLSLPAKHGFPVRMVTPGLYGFVGSTKWLTRMTVTSYDKQQAYWTKRKWATDAPIKPSARIDTPRSFATVKGRTVIGGVAWAQQQGVMRVQVRIDGAAWRDCELGPKVNVDYWRQWAYVWENPGGGQHTIEARVLFGSDEKAQDPTRAGLFPDGSSGIQELIVTGE